MTALNPQHPMSQVAQENAVKFIACVIWKLRKHCPNLAVEITTKDMQELNGVFMNHNQRGVLAVFGKGDSIILQLVDAASGKMLITTEGDEHSPNAVMMRKLLDARRRAPVIADALLTEQPESVDRNLRGEAAEILKLLTWEPRQ